MRLEVRNLRKNFGEKEVLHGISFSIENHIFCLQSFTFSFLFIL